MYISLSNISGVGSKKDKLCAESDNCTTTQSETQQIGALIDGKKSFEWLVRSFLSFFFYYICMELFYYRELQNDSLVKYMTLYTAGTK